MIPREVLFIWAEAERDRRAGNRLIAAFVIVVLAVVSGWLL